MAPAIPTIINIWMDKHIAAEIIVEIRLTLKNRFCDSSEVLCSGFGMGGLPIYKIDILVLAVKRNSLAATLTFLTITQFSEKIQI